MIHTDGKPTIAHYGSLVDNLDHSVKVPAKIAYRCPECEQQWTWDEDPQEWAFGHDCEC